MGFRRSIVVAALAALAVAPAAHAGSGFYVGFDEDGVKLEGAAAGQPIRDLGAEAARITLAWSPGQTAVTSTDVADVKRAVSAAPGLRVIVAAYATGTNAPTDATRRGQYCQFLRSLLSKVSAIKDVVIWNEPNYGLFWKPQFNPDGSSAAPAAYEALLAACWDVLHTARPSVNVIGLVNSPVGNDNPAGSSPSHSPGNFIRKVGDAYRASGRTKPIMDTVGHHVYGETNAERPWRQHIGSKTISQGDWNKLMSNLATAFAGTAQRLPGQCAQGRCVSILYLEGGFQTTPIPEKASLYTGLPEPGTIPDDAGGEPDFPPPSADSPAPDQSTQIRDAVRLAYCQPYVSAFFNFLLWDERAASGWQSGAFWVDRTPKRSWPAFQQVIGEANAGAVDCAHLKGGPPSADYTPPAAVADLSGASAADPLRVELAWSPSSDNSGTIAGYRVYRGGAYYAWSATTAYTDTKVVAGTSYAYTVYAQDAAGNVSESSNKVTVTAVAAPAPASYLFPPAG